jgi:CRISPR-associated endonuclease Cas2
VNAPFTYLVAYDVTDDNRRTQLAELLFDLGGTRLQKSFFSVVLDDGGLAELRRKARSLIVGTDDKLGWWRTCGNCPGVVAKTRNATVPPAPTGNELWMI